MEIVKNVGNTMLTIINDILDFSKIESGHLELEKTYKKNLSRQQFSTCFCLSCQVETGLS